MKLLVINPNTCEEMTDDIRYTIQKIVSANVVCEVVSPDFGPRSLESFYDYSLATFGIQRLLYKKESDYNGILIACFGDPGLFSYKEIANCPVLGIAESSISMSLLLGDKFAILGASNKAIPMMSNMVRQYGLDTRFAGAWALNMSVLDVESNKQEATKRLIATGQAAKEKGADVLILGCAGMTGLTTPVEEALQMPILDPVECGYRALEMMVFAGYKTAKSGLFSTPSAQQIVREELLKGQNGAL